MSTRFPSAALLYFDSKRMQLNDTTKFTYFSGIRKFSHNLTQITVKEPKSSRYSSIVMVSTTSYFSRIYFFIRGLYPFPLLHASLHCDVILLLSQAWRCALLLSSLSRKICASKQSYGNGEKGNPICRNSDKIYIGRHEVLILRRCKKSIASAYNIKYLMG